ncbi:type IV pilus twitching motility protein PilT [Clostridium sp.]|uniref:type IV pilus twitching motility protein PilT n=1 Tax=Clostridium sp. TaxID=1506 RepID=UPI003D6C7777
MDREKLNNLLLYAMKEKASSLHLSAGIAPAIRVNGFLKYTDFDKFSTLEAETLINWFVSQDNHLILEEKGSCDFTHSIDKRGRFRVNVYKQRGSFSITFKIGFFSVHTKEYLKLPDCVDPLCNLTSGLIIISGTSSSGRTSTATYIIDQIRQTLNGHIVTIENPIEYLFKHDQSIVSQKEIGLDVTSFDDGIEAVLYQDADVIYVSELKNALSISKILDFAQSGKLVVAVMNTKDVLDTLQFFINISPKESTNWNRQQLANCLRGIISQKLLPTNENTMVPAFEILLQTTAISNLLKENKISQIPIVLENSLGLGMTTFNTSIAQLFHSGTISKDTALNSTSNTTDMLNKLSVRR